MKKRILSFVSVLLMLAMLSVPFAAQAEGDTAKPIEVTIGSMSAAQGDEIDVPVTVDQNPGIWGINWKLYYDSQVLRFDGIEFKDAFSDLGLLDTNEVKYPVVINGMGSSVTENVETTGVMAVIHFKVYVGVALGDTKITLKADAGNNINVDGNDVELKVNESTITVTEGLVSSDNKDDYPPKDPLQEAQRQNTPVGQSSKSNEGGLKWWWFIIGAVILLAIVVVIWLFSGSDEEDEGEAEMLTGAEKEAADEAAFLAMLSAAEAEAPAEEAAEEIAEDKPEE